MKKLIIAAGALCAAVVVQAAQVNWSAWGYSGDPADDASWYDGGQAYLVLITDTSNFSVGTGGDGLVVTGGSIVDSADIVGGSTAGAWQDATLTAGQNYYFSVIMTTEGEAGTTLPTSGLYGYVAFADATQLDEAFSADTGGTWGMNDTFNDGNGIDVSNPIPEPTSGLLMLLGMAGLALRRRRA